MRLMILAVLGVSTHILLALAMSHNALAQSAEQPTANEQIVKDIEATLKAHYVFADKVDGIMAELRQQEALGIYTAANDANSLAEQLSADLIAATGDYHFSVRHDPFKADEVQDPKEVREVWRKANFEFVKVEILPGNVGYLRFDYFAHPDDVYHTVVAALRFVENADALIIDMRYNRGGHMGTAQLLMSHLFTGESDQELFDYSYVEDGRTVARGMWVLHGVPGKRMSDVPIFVLTSTTTFSAGEWFSYSLGELGRATLVGRRTAGAAHPVDVKRINDLFVLQVPIGVIRGPISRTDFEGTGVMPDQDVPSHEALDVAYKLALEQIEGVDPESKANWYSPIANARLSVDATIESDARDIVGRYEGRQVSLENGTLIYRWRERFSLALFPIGDGLFRVEGTDEYRFRLLRDNGLVTGLQREMRDGSASIYSRVAG